MIRHFQQQSPSAAPANFSPPDNYLWKVLLIRLSLTTGTGTGSRQGKISAIDFDNVLYFSLVDTGVQTSVSTVYDETLGPIGSATNILYAPVVLDATMGFNFVFTLISGDSVTWDIMVDQVYNV